MTAHSAPILSAPDTTPFIAPSPQPPAALLHALHGAPAQAPYGGGGDWFLGNGAPLPAHCTGHASIPTPSSTLHLNHVLISPDLIKNLISVRALTRDNSVSVEFDPLGFSIKDLRTKTILLRCDSSGELYPLRSP
jgi:hypothetical protein